MPLHRVLLRCWSYQQVNALIEKANILWDERNAAAVAMGEKEIPRMLPLIRLKVRLPRLCRPV